MKQSANNILTKFMMLSMFVSIMGLWSCDQVYDLPVKPSLDTAIDSLMFGKEGGQQNIEFTANRAWTAKLSNNKTNDDTEWCTVSTLSGNSGKQTITITVKSLDGDYRKALLLLNCSGSGSEIPVMQSGKPILTTADASMIDESNATLGGAWYYSGIIDVTEVGVAVAPESTGSFTNYKLVIDSVKQRTFAGLISNLSNATKYLYKFYIKTSTGESHFGEQKSFSTDVVPVRLAVKDLVARGKALSDGGSKEQTASEFIAVTISNVVEAADIITLSLVDNNCTADATAGKSVANYGITATIVSNANTLGIYHFGDVLTIRTKGTLLSNKNGDPLLAIRNLSNMKTTATGASLTPVKVVHNQLSNYLAMYVAIDNTQITKSYLNVSTYPSWGTTSFTMEVNGSEESYLMKVPAGASFAGDKVLTGSGTLKGIVAPGQIGYLLSPRSASDLAGLTNTRFISMLGLRFFDPVFNGVLTLGEASTSYITIPYKNGDGSTVPAIVSVSMSGAAAAGLTVVGIVDPKVGIGIGSLKLEVTGTPTADGIITFTVNGFQDYLSNQTATATVLKPELPVVGNFEVVWNVSTNNYATTMAFTTNSNPAITVSNLVATNFNGSSLTTKYAKDFATTGCDQNTDANRISNPVVYLKTTLKIPAGKILYLSGLDITCRTNGGDSKVSIQYALDGTNFTEIDYNTQASGIQSTINLGKLGALKNVVEGSTVTFRIVPVNTNAAAKWGINGNNTARGLAIYGEVADK